jgi:hypothetical protein
MQEILYLSSLESVRFEPVRQCIFVKKLRFDTGKECALVRLSPGVVGQDFNVGAEIEQFILANRHGGATLFPIKRFPCFVHIARLLIESVDRDVITKDDVEVIPWGELYRSQSDAKRHAFDK